MKKIISVLLAVVMLFTMGTMAFAVVIEDPADCRCTDHVSKPANSCHCCVLCPNIDKAYLTSCATKDSADGASYDGTLCCSYCTGIFPCKCGCECCDPDNKETSGGVLGDGNEIWNEEAQDDFVTGFQKILKRISDAFNSFFDKIFEFLRVDDLLGSIN